MADLKVDYALLSSTESTLSSLIGEFSRIESSTGSYDGALGSGDIEGAMGSFAGNWDSHRKQLTDSMRSLGDLVSAARKHFQDADGKLASQLTASKSGK